MTTNASSFGRTYARKARTALCMAVLAGLRTDTKASKGGHGQYLDSLCAEFRRLCQHACLCLSLSIYLSICLSVSVSCRAGWRLQAFAESGRLPCNRLQPPVSMTVRKCELHASMTLALMVVMVVRFHTEEGCKSREKGVSAWFVCRPT